MKTGSGKNIRKMYIYTNSQIIAQHDGCYTDDRYFYLHDRLGSVRQLIDNSGDVVKLYTYDPFGEMLESAEQDQNMKNPFKFTGQYFDDEIIDEYYLRARQYNPHIGRFTSRDPACGKFKEPMTLHKYLYCLNNPINNTDPTGKYFVINTIYGISNYYAMLDAGLSAAAGDWWAVMDAAITTNAWREAWFDPQNLANNPYVVDWASMYASRQINKIEAELWRLTAGAMQDIYNSCDYEGLAGCLWTDVGITALIEVPVYVVGKLTCAFCYGTVAIPDGLPILDEAASCGICVGYEVWKSSKGLKTVQDIGTAVTIGTCLEKHCPR